MLSFICTVSAQKKNAQTRKPSKTEVIRSNTIKWFKETYVPHFFKNPSSYKFVKCNVAPKTKGKMLEELIVTSTRNIPRYKQLAERYRFVSPNEYATKYHDAVDTKERAEKLYSELSEQQKKEIDHYEIYYECYGTNSFGGRILSSYIMKADADGNLDYESIECLDE